MCPMLLIKNLANVKIEMLARVLNITCDTHKDMS